MLRDARAAVEAGRMADARNLLETVVRHRPRDAVLHHNLAEVRLASGDLEGAVNGYTRSLAVDPSQRASAERLAGILEQIEPYDVGGIDPVGLGAALATEGISHSPLARLGLRFVGRHGPLASILETGRAGNWDAAANAALEDETRPHLADPLLLKALANGINRNPDWEKMLTALRKALLLAAPPSLFEEAAVREFCIALAQQCLNNEHVLYVSEPEISRLEGLPPETAALLMALYVDPELVVQEIALDRIEPVSLRNLVSGHLSERADERSAAAQISSLGFFTDSTTRAVAEQYEGNPYPRWTTLNVPPPNSRRMSLSSFYDASSLDVFDRPVDVLIAGCGTGRHAVQAAHGYGPNSKVLAVDLSRASLGYAARMAITYGAGNLEFLQADILELERLGRHFDFIESVGVLHHLAAPEAGWRVLERILVPGGFMRIGLYSEKGRAYLDDLKSKLGVAPGSIGDDAIRDFRYRVLTEAADCEEVLSGVDFYALSSCRDLFFHVQEQRFTIARIADCVGELGLEFLGFDVAPKARALFEQRFASSGERRSLQCWPAFEKDTPEAFGSMYRFWCRKPTGG